MTDVGLLDEMLGEYLNPPRDTMSNSNRHRRGTGEPSALRDALEDFCAYIGHLLDDFRDSLDKLNIWGNIAERIAELLFSHADILALPGEPEEVPEGPADQLSVFVWSGSAAANEPVYTVFTDLMAEVRGGLAWTRSADLSFAAPRPGLGRVHAAFPGLAGAITFALVMRAACMRHGHRHVPVKRDPCLHADTRRCWGVALS